MFADLTDARHARQVAAALVASGAFTVDMRLPRDQWFRWKSGILAPCGCNCRRLNAVPALRRLVDDALADAVRSAFPGAGYIVAVAHAGIPWAKTVAERLDLPLAYVRAEAREPGGPLVECEPATGGRAVIIEDVVASGGSAARAIRALLAETSLCVAGVQSIANWNFPEMRERLAPWPVRAVTSYPQVLDSAQEAGLLSGADVRELLRFYADPRRHRWPPGTAGPPGPARPGHVADAPLSRQFGCNTCFISDYREPCRNTYYNSATRITEFRNTYYKPAGQNDRLN
ncbi:MAG: orotate phosphoribosyltransferase [Trebonia sp.]